MNNIKSLMVMSLLIMCTSAFAEFELIATISGEVALSNFDSERNGIAITCKLCMDSQPDCTTSSQNATKILEWPRDCGLNAANTLCGWTLEFRALQARLVQEHMTNQFKCAAADREPENYIWVDGAF